MVLNYIWIAFFLIAFLIALLRLVLQGDTTLFPAIVNGVFEAAKTGFTISIGLTGIMTFWLGIMKIGEKAGAINFLSRLVGPFFSKLFPEVPKDHPAMGNMLMNFSANMLGLDNAATPLGLKAMNSLQELNPDKETASNAQIMFLVLNTAGFTMIPVSIMVYRAQAGAANPSDVFIPILLATFCASLVGMLSVAVWQKINLFDKVFMSWMAGILLIVSSVVYYFHSLSKDEIEAVSKTTSGVIIFSIISVFIAGGLWRKINVYETFIEGAKDGFTTAVKIIPYLVGMLVAVAAFRESGAMNVFLSGAEKFFAFLGCNTDFVPALPTAMMKPLSGSGARTMMLDAMHTKGADSFVGRLACIIQGSADTTFYIVALYFGSVGIRKTRYAIVGGLIADIAGMTAAVFIAYLFFG